MKFDWHNALARNTDPVTSHEAAEEVPVTKIEKIVLEAYKTADNGLTADELSNRVNLPLNTITPRIAPLVRKGFLMPTGKRPGKSGRNQRVHIYV